MNKKISWSILLVLVVALCVINARASNAKDLEKSDFVLLIDNTDNCLIDCHTTYRVCNPTANNIGLDDKSRFDIKFTDSQYTVRDYHYEILTPESYDYTYWASNVSCTTYEYSDGNATVSDGTEALNDTPAEPKMLTGTNCTDNGAYVTESRTRNVFKEFDPKDKMLRADECYTIRVVGKIRPTLGAKVDNVLSYAGYDFSEFAWWNNSCMSKRLINVTAPTDANLTEGFYFPKITLNATQVIFVDNNNSNVLPYTIYTNGSSNLTYYVRTPNITAGSSYTMYAYYCDFNRLNSSFMVVNKELVSIPMEENSTVANATADVSGNSRNGTVSNSSNLAFINNCVLGSCWNWTALGGDVGIMFDASKMNFYGPTSYLFYTKPISTNYQYELMYTNNPYSDPACSGPGNGIGLYIDSTINNVSAFWGTGTNPTGGPVTYNSWESLIYMNNGSLTTIWKDGVQLAVISNSSMSPSLGSCSWLGRQNTAPAWTFRGSMDEFRVINRSLTSDELKSHFHTLNQTATIQLLSINSINDQYANESVARTAIELGIAQSKAVSGFIRTDQVVFERNMQNTQTVGRFDKVLIYGNQRWLFNYVTPGTSDVFLNPFNITPVVYVYEMSNVSASNITSRVQGLIDSTITS